MFFIDIEASSLLSGSYPIEVAWVDADGRGEGYLIRPHAEWLRRGTWSPESEAVHGLSLATLLAEGHPVAFVADRLMTALAGQQVYSAAPGHDGMWLDRLLDYGDRPERIDIEPVEEAYGSACRRLIGLKASDQEKRMASAVCIGFVAAAKSEEGGRRKAKQRAFEDAMALWRTWRSVDDKVNAWLRDHASKYGLER